MKAMCKSSGKRVKTDDTCVCPTCQKELKAKWNGTGFYLPAHKPQALTYIDTFCK